MSDDRRRLVVATRNDHKVRELGRLLPGLALEALPADVVMPPEDGATYAENALIKARAAVAATGRAAIADDSGVEAEALGGRPGIRSARFAGEQASDGENLAKLRAEAPPGSGLRYVCAIAHVTADGAEHVVEGVCEGTVAGDARGEGGFGYDPAFLPADAVARGRTMAELGDGEKDAISHRGRAARALLAWLASGGR
jgi:XTP/dITP diphosphohydrolase